MKNLQQIVDDMNSDIIYHESAVDTKWNQKVGIFTWVGLLL